MEFPWVRSSPREPHPRHFDTVTCVARRLDNEQAPSMHRASAMNPPVPRPPQPKKTSPPERQTPPAINPDPKSHPMHPASPQKPIHEGTDPKTPVTTPSASWP
jgi:hypothetical protein